MTASNRKVERIVVGLLLCIALLTFFSTLVNLRIPVGDQLGDISDVRAALNLLRSSVNLFAIPKISDDRDASTRSVKEELTMPKPLVIPYSLKVAPLLPWFLFSALACAALALVNHLFFQKAVAAISLVGGCLGALAVVPIILM